MKIDTTGFTDKASKNSDEMRLYVEADNYIDAYSKHTDLRVRRDGHAQAIGGDWETHGPLQLTFLRSHGLTPESKLLDFGCGTGRLARHAVPFLNSGHYTGVDISGGALEYARKLAKTEGWDHKRPMFIQSLDGDMSQVMDKTFNIIWMHSVFTHLPKEIITHIFKQIARMQWDVWIFTFKRRDKPMRTGLKQFGYPAQFFIDKATSVGLKAEDLHHAWPQGQDCIKVW